MVDVEIKAQLSHLRRLMQHKQTDTLENRRHFNSLVQQYKALRGGALSKEDLKTQFNTYMPEATIRIIYDVDNIGDYESIQQLYGGYLLSNQELRLIQTAEGDLIWGKYDKEKKKCTVPGTLGEKSIKIDVAAQAAASTAEEANVVIKAVEPEKKEEESEEPVVLKVPNT